MRLIATTLAALLIPALAQASAPPQCPMVLDFDTDSSGNAIAAGQDLWLGYDGWGIDLTTWNSMDMTSAGMGIAFDSSNPPGLDYDLGTPNASFGGPGIGQGGEAGSPGENANALGNLLISADNFVDANGDGLIDVPDSDASGAWFEFNFDAPTCVFGVTLVDIDANEGASDILHYGPSGDTLLHASPAALGNNSVDTLTYEVCGVSWMLVDIYGSGGIDGLQVCVGGTPEVCDGQDNDGDGQIDVEVSWTSDLDGMLGNEPPNADGDVQELLGGMSAGDHVVTFEVEDPALGRCWDAVFVSVSNRPEVTISAPLNGAIFEDDDPILLAGTATDAEDGSQGLTVDWSSETDGDLGTATTDGDGYSEVIYTGLSIGEHTLRMQVTDLDGVGGSAEVGITIIAAAER